MARPPRAGPAACSTRQFHCGAATGRFHDICTQQPGYREWTPIHVTIDEAVAAGRITEDWRAAREIQWGVDSQPYRTYVLAEFAGEADGVIPMGWIEAAMDRTIKDPVLARVGVDVGDTGDDDTVAAYACAEGVFKLEELSGDVVLIADLLATRTTPETIHVIDGIGIGAGTVAQARKLGLKVDSFIASAGTTRTDATGEIRFANLRAAAWWTLRELLSPTNPEPIALPNDPRLLGDLAAPRWREVAGGKIVIESKADIRKRFGRSTDYGDAVVMSMWTHHVEWKVG